MSNIKIDPWALAQENQDLRNEIARLNGQTRWQCKCGGTDCEGQRENEHLRRSLEVTRQIKCARIVEAEKLDILRGCLEDILKLNDIHEAHLFAKQALRDTKGGEE